MMVQVAEPLVPGSGMVLGFEYAAGDGVYLNH
jgi:hypothetical protein